jgi:hypothetical protein
MSWNLHINNLTNKGLSTLGFMKHNLKGCPEYIKLLAYKSLVRPVLEYAATVWDPHYSTLIDQIEKVQRMSVRFIKSDYSRYSSVTNMINNLELTLLADRRKISRLTLFHKIHHKSIAIHFPTDVVPSTSKARHCNFSNYRHIYARTEMFKGSFYPKTITNWNTLKEDIITILNPETFKNTLQSLSS